VGVGDDVYVGLGAEGEAPDTGSQKGGEA